MVYDLDFNEEKNLFILRTRGFLTTVGIQEMVKELISHPQWRKGRNLFIDHREASFEKISSEDMKNMSLMVMTLDKQLGANKCAVVSPEDAYFKHAQYQASISPKADLVTRIFWNDQYDAAVKWIEEDL